MAHLGQVGGALCVHLDHRAALEINAEVQTVDADGCERGHNTQQGDGFRFRGRGLIQITGRANYRECATALGVPLILHPEALERPDIAATASAWWWADNGLNSLADAGNVDHVSDRINRGRITAKVGDSNGYPERALLTERALRVLRA